MAAQFQLQQLTSNRKANGFKPVESVHADRNSYPATSPAFVHSIHDLGYLQGILSNRGNFASRSEFEMISNDSSAPSRQNVCGESECRTSFEACLYSCPSEMFSY